MITCFISYSAGTPVEPAIAAFRDSALTDKIFLIPDSDVSSEQVADSTILVDGSFYTTRGLQRIADQAQGDYTLFYTQSTKPVLGLFALERLIDIARDTQAGMIYSDHYKSKGGTVVSAPVIDYQEGSLRDDFDFGSLMIFRTDVLKDAIARASGDYTYAGLYDLRLKLSQRASIIHVNEYLYTDVEYDARLSGQKLFDYVDPRNRVKQIEMEAACTAHLKDVGAYLVPTFRSIDFSDLEFPFEASVIIPVRNRIATIRDAVKSVLSQKTRFKFNLIVVDNHSTDGTTEALREFSHDDKLIHIVPERTDLQIGGCWNTAVHHRECGKFAIQLDSDDVYKDEHTLQKIVDAFYEQNCAMIVGTYMMTDFDFNTLPPGVIDHKEWTPDNGRNNALRINGLGAPRAFYTPLLRQINLPNTSYGEDYALGLRFSRHYQIGRIYDVLYLCRRWNDNSDAALDAEKTNRNNFYKDRIRTWELQARIAYNKNRVV